MGEETHLFDVVVVLFAAIVAAVLFQRARLGIVLGYLIAGAAIGPSGLSLVSADEVITGFAEMGVVFLLFTIGLELPIGRIRTMRTQVFGLGAAQVVATAVILGGMAYAAGATGPAAVVIGAALALSSTAMVVRLLADRGHIAGQLGRSAISILIMQDLAVGPLLVVVLALGGSAAALASSLGLAILKGVVAVAAILGLGRLALRFVYEPVGKAQAPEIFIALTLFVVLGTGLITRVAGLSMAFGAFLAGMLLADSHYRHQVAADIRPLRALLLGLFFMAVGMTIDLDAIRQEAFLILALAAGLLVAKTLVLVCLARLFRLPTALALDLGLLLSQAGEFAFVLVGAGMATGAVDVEQGQRLFSVVAVTMMATPVLSLIGGLLASRVTRRSLPVATAAVESGEEIAGHVVVVGCGRVGGAAALRLQAAAVPLIAVDIDPQRIAQARQRDLPAYYGDARQADILAAVGVDRARALVVCLNDPRAALQVVTFVRYLFPDLPIHARAADAEHAEELLGAGANSVVTELLPTGQQLAQAILAPDIDAGTKAAAP